MAWGDWFRLVPKGEATKLARVQIDFPNSADESWTIDIKKSRARPPHAVRERLRQIVSRITARSTTVHRGRGSKLFDELTAPLWERYADQNTIRYTINSAHPLLSRLTARMEPAMAKETQLLIEAIGSALPVEMIYSDYSTAPRQVDQSPVGADQIEGRLAALKALLFGDQPGDAESFREVVRSTRIFENHTAKAEHFIAEEFP